MNGVFIAKFVSKAKRKIRIASRYNPPMFKRFQKFFKEEFHCRFDQPLIVGVSGGTDSLCLLEILVRMEYPIIVAHFNHLLRAEANEDAKFVEGVAEKFCVPFISETQPVADHARENGLTIEEAARKLRYRFFFEQAEIQDAQAVVVAHNADDQVETVLMHLLRGSGLAGLTGMSYRSLPNPWSETVPLLRPFLNTWRAEIENYCHERGLVPLIDVTNADTTYFRNRIRHELLPELETYVPGFRKRLHQTADLLTTDRRQLDDLTNQAWDALDVQSNQGYIIFNLQSFHQQPLALRRRLIRKAVTHLRPNARDIDFALVQRALDFAENPTATRQLDLGLNLRIELEAGRLVVADWMAELPTDHCPLITGPLKLSIPGELDLGNGWILKAAITSNLAAAQKAAKDNPDPFRAWVDLGRQQTSLEVRPRQPGDRFQPLGMAGKSMKLSDFMINEKIPKRLRSKWPLVCQEPEIIWVPGYRLNHAFRVNEETSQIVLLTLHKE